MSPPLKESGCFLSGMSRRQSGERLTMIGSSYHISGRLDSALECSREMPEARHSPPTSTAATLGREATKINNCASENGRCTFDRGKSGRSGDQARRELSLILVLGVTSVMN